MSFRKTNIRFIKFNKNTINYLQQSCVYCKTHTVHTHTHIQILRGQRGKESKGPREARQEEARRASRQSRQRGQRGEAGGAHSESKGPREAERERERAKRIKDGKKERTDKGVKRERETVPR